MVENFMRVLLPTVASVRVARIPSLATTDLPQWGTGVSIAGTGEASRRNRQRSTLTVTKPTSNHYFSTKTVVVDDIPGVRTWSPPV